MKFRIDGEVLLQKATGFAKELKHDKAPCRAWIDRWKKRWNVPVGKILMVGRSWWCGPRSGNTMVECGHERYSS